MKYCLTGHLGLIGSALNKRLQEAGHKPALLVDLRDGTDIRNLTDEVEADICFHLAAHCSIANSIRFPNRVYTHNVTGTYCVMEFIRRSKIPKVVFTSSTRVLYPEKNPYTASKIYGEELVKAYQECFGINYTIIRPSTVFAPFDDLTGRLIDKWMRAVLKNEPLKIYGDWNKTLDFTYIDDFLDGFMLAATKDNEDYDIATGSPERLVDVAKHIIDMASSSSPIQFMKAEMAQPQEVSIDISKIENIGYKPRVGLEEGLKRTLSFYKGIVK